MLLALAAVACTGVDENVLLARGGDDDSVQPGATLGTARHRLTTNGVVSDTATVHLAVGSDGVMVVGVNVATSDGIGRMMLTRVRADGSVDSSFGDRGSVALSPYVPKGRMVGLTLREDGHMRVAVSLGERRDMGVLALDANGAIEADFADRGLALVANVSATAARLLARDANGNLLVAGTSNNGATDGPPRARLGKLDANGAVVRGFASTGVATVDVGAAITPTALTYSGGVWLAGALAVNNALAKTHAVVGLEDDGSPRSGFGVDGVATMNDASLFTLTRIVGRDGWVYLMGGGRTRRLAMSDGAFDFTWSINNEGTDFAFDDSGRVTTVGVVDKRVFIRRYLDTSAPDNSFGSGSTLDNPYSTPVMNPSLVVQGGQLYVAASAGRQGVLLARHHTDGSLDTAFAGSGVVVVPLDFADVAVSGIRSEANGIAVSAEAARIDVGATASALAILTLSSDLVIATGSPLVGAAHAMPAVSAVASGITIRAVEGFSLNNDVVNLASYGPAGRDPVFGGGSDVPVPANRVHVVVPLPASELLVVDNEAAALVVQRYSATGVLVPNRRMSVAVEETFMGFAARPDGSFVIASRATDGARLRRFDAGFTRVDGFGANGVTNLATDNVTAMLDGAALYIATRVVTFDGSWDAGLLAFGADGTVIAGTTLVREGSDESITSLAIDAAGRIVVAGTTRTGAERRGFVARISSALVLDTSFGTGGFALASGTPSAYDAITLASDGTILVAGADVDSFGVARLAP